MRIRVNVLLACGAVILLQAALPIASIAETPADSQQGADQWLGSFAITGGAIIQEHQGEANSVQFEGANPNPVPLRGFFDGTDLAVGPFVSASVELMTPELPIPFAPRVFAGAEILPIFAPKRSVALEGDPECVRGPEPDAPCARFEDGTSRRRAFATDAANGQGTRTVSRLARLAYGAHVGVAVPVKMGKRKLRVKPSVGWINYEVEGEGLVVHAQCDPPSVCTDVMNGASGFLRETILAKFEHQRFNGVGPGLDLEVETGRFGPIGSALFLGVRAYKVLGNRKINIRAAKLTDDQVNQSAGRGPDRSVGTFTVEVDPWLFRAHVGLRLLWLGFTK